MEEHCVNFIWECVPIMIQKLEDEFNTVIFAIGRDACKAKISLEGEGVALNPKNGKVLHNELERSGVDNIYALTHLSPGVSLIYDLVHDSGILQSELFTRGSQNLILAKLPSSGFWRYGQCFK